MKRIKSARLMRATEKEGKTTAEVEFSLEPGTVGNVENGGRYVAVLERENGRPYALTKVMRNEAKHELDWYDNPEHRAYAEVTEQFAGLADPDFFVEDLLNTGDVGRDLNGDRKTRA